MSSITPVLDFKSTLNKTPIDAPSGYEGIVNSKVQIVITTWKTIDKAVDASKRRGMGVAISDKGVRSIYTPMFIWASQLINRFITTST
ncbi:unnamed protein product [Clonostachys solani]|uniref:Uncharacterized protein n=1 Tax=Clonostachys solani TaxID=160281 RepID=A0A9N9ZIY9_9HYPO|nr:unnamed protein product [Clonostachys solani]